MAGLQRSQMSFRRQGSSGLVWDDKFLSEEIERAKQEAAAAGGGGDDKDDNIKAVAAAAEVLRRSRSEGGRGGCRKSTYRTVKVGETEDPPSPKVAACGFCSIFGKPAAREEQQRKRSSGKK